MIDKGIGRMELGAPFLIFLMGSFTTGGFVADRDAERTYGRHGKLVN